MFLGLMITITIDISEVVEYDNAGREVLAVWKAIGGVTTRHKVVTGVVVPLHTTRPRGPNKRLAYLICTKQRDNRREQPRIERHPRHNKKLKLSKIEIGRLEK